jgi:FkbM family methyltransferase
VCRLQDAGDPVSVYVDQDYRNAPVEWLKLRTIVDVGATAGAFTVWASKRAPQSRIIAVEPNPAVYPYLTRNVALNGLEDRVACFETALGDLNGHAAIADDTVFSTLTRVVPTSMGRGPSVKMITLETLLNVAQIDRCDLLKIDCEGSEYEIILSMSTRVLQKIGAIICEYHPRTDYDLVDLLNHLRAAGFRLQVDEAAVGFIRAWRPDA